MELLTVVVDPSFYGLIDTSIILVLRQEDGTEHKIELPIIGNVMRSNSILAVPRTKSNNFEPWLVATPAVTLRVGDYLEDPNKKGTSLLKSKLVEERLNLRNNLNTTLSTFEVVLAEDTPM